MDFTECKEQAEYKLTPNLPHDIKLTCRRYTFRSEMGHANHFMVIGNYGFQPTSPMWLCLSQQEAAAVYNFLEIYRGGND